MSFRIISVHALWFLFIAFHSFHLFPAFLHYSFYLAISLNYCIRSFQRSFFLSSCISSFVLIPSCFLPCFLDCILPLFLHVLIAVGCAFLIISSLVCSYIVMHSCCLTPLNCLLYRRHEKTCWKRARKSSAPRKTNFVVASGCRFSIVCCLLQCCHVWLSVLCPQPAGLKREKQEILVLPLALTFDSAR